MAKAKTARLGPIATYIPGETTVQVATCHHLLNELKVPAAWFFCPTTNEEKTLNYDVSLQRFKVLVIQFKALAYAGNPTKRFDLDKQQLKALKNYVPPRGKKPYVFYGIMDFAQYQDMDDAYVNGGGAGVLKHAIFVNAHEIPDDANSVAWDGQKMQTNQPGGVQSPLAHWLGDTFVQELKACKLGLASTDRGFPAGNITFRTEAMLSGLAVLTMPLDN